MNHVFAVLDESLRIARSRIGTSVVVAFLVAAACLGVLLTAGRTVAVEDSVLARIDQAGTKTVTVRTTGGQPLRAAMLDVLAASDQVDDVYALGPITDGRNVLVPGAEPVPVRRIYGRVNGTLLIPAADENTSVRVAYLSTTTAATLGMIDGVGGIQTTDGRGLAVREWPGVPPPGLGDLTPSALIPSSTAEQPAGTDPDAPVTLLVAVAASPQDVETVAALMTSLTRYPGAPAASIDTSADLIAVRAAVHGQLGSFGRSAILGVLGLVVILVTIALLALMNGRRRDFGRRRALGASQSLIIALVLLQVGLPALAGSALGIASGWIVAVLRREQMPSAEFVAALAITSTLAAVLAAIIPATIAARREPLHELRVP